MSRECGAVEWAAFAADGWLCHGGARFASVWAAITAYVLAFARRGK